MNPDDDEYHGDLNDVDIWMTCPELMVLIARCRGETAKDKWFIQIGLTAPPDEEIMDDKPIETMITVHICPDLYFDSWEDAVAHAVKIQTVLGFERLLPDHPAARELMNPYLICDFDHETGEEHPFFVDVMDSTINVRRQLTPEQRTRVQTGSGAIN